MSPEQANLLRAAIRADLEYREGRSKTDAVQLNKAVTGFSLRTAQSLTSFGVGHIDQRKEGNFYSLHNYPTRK